MLVYHEKLAGYASRALELYVTSRCSMQLHTFAGTPNARKINPISHSIPRILPAVLIMEAIYHLNRLLHFLLSGRPSIEDGAICTGTQHILDGDNQYSGPIALRLPLTWCKEP